MDLHRSVGLETPTLRRADIAAVTGVPREQSVRWWRAMGFPEVGDDVVAFSEVDVDLVQRVAGLVDAGLVDDDDVARLARLLGASCQRIAEAQLELADEIFERAANLDPDAAASDRLKVLLDERGTALMMLLERSVVYVWKRHMQAALGRHLDTGLDSVHSTDVLAVGFADLAGFTKLSKGLTPPELTEVIDGFEAAAFESAAGTDGRVVKLIGDEVMFVAPTVVGAARIALDLRDRLAAIPEMPTIHCGIAVGPTVGVGGDVFGTTVNLASRLTSVARKGTIVIPRSCVDELSDAPDLVVRPTRRSYSLKGIGDTRIAVVDRAPVTDD
ncbi:MAG: adenylate/guanylate cyclase domain-containing protein [Microthrixaceae bacterium]|nr:adenylate/guanylate cyclase domain-containing protein [Microthrixaceae bacterium]